MPKVFLSPVMICIGIVGLAATACGVAFLPVNGVGLIGIVPGGLFSLARKAAVR